MSMGYGPYGLWLICAYWLWLWPMGADRAMGQMGLWGIGLWAMGYVPWPMDANGHVTGPWLWDWAWVMGHWPHSPWLVE